MLMTLGKAFELDQQANYCDLHKALRERIENVLSLTSLAVEEILIDAVNTHPYNFISILNRNMVMVKELYGNLYGKDPNEENDFAKFIKPFCLNKYLNTQFYADKLADEIYRSESQAQLAANHLFNETTDPNVSQYLAQIALCIREIRELFELISLQEPQLRTDTQLSLTHDFETC